MLDPNKNITIKLECQDIKGSDNKGKLFMAIHGTVIKRIVDSEGIELFDQDGNIVHEHAQFVIKASEVDKKLPNIIRKLADEALTLQRKENEKNKNKKEGIKSPSESSEDKGE